MNKGSASHDSFLEHNHQHTMDFSKVMEHILSPKKQLLENQIDKVVQDSELNKLLEKYPPSESSTLKEPDLYEPFVAIANRILECLGLHQIEFCRNDPKRVCGSRAKREPDVVGVLATALRRFRGTNVDELSVKGPDVAFYWEDVKSFVEFKFDRRFKWGAPVPEHSPSVRDEPPPERKPPPSDSPPRFSARSTTAATKKSDTQKRESSEANSDANKRIKFNDDESGKPRDNNLVQCASYAREMMSCGGLRSHVVGCLITNCFLEIVYYDHSAVIMSRAIHFKKNLRSFVQFLHAFVSGGEGVWGCHSILKEPQTEFWTQERAIQLQELARVDAFENFTLRLQDGRTLTLGTTVFQARGLIGRGTLVVRATMPQEAKTVIVKLSHLPKTRTSESEIIYAIRNASGRAGPRPDGRNMTNHLPQIIHAEEREYGLDTPQGRLAEFYKNDNNPYELRDLCILVQDELHPITNLTTADELASAFRDIFEAYRWLCEDVKIMHRDISINNLMVRYQDGRHYGVLNDFDLAIEVGKDLLPMSKQRTGTKPFMAYDILDDQLQI